MSRSRETVTNPMRGTTRGSPEAFRRVSEGKTLPRRKSYSSVLLARSTMWSLAAMIIALGDTSSTEAKVESFEYAVSRGMVL